MHDARPSVHSCSIQAHPSHRVRTLLPAYSLPESPDTSDHGGGTLQMASVIGEKLLAVPSKDMVPDGLQREELNRWYKFRSCDLMGGEV